MKCSDEWRVQHISENPYLQYFLGLKAYTSKYPFGASTMVEFRKRFPPEAIVALLEASAKQDRDDDHPNDGTFSGGTDEQKEEQLPNQGALLMDATCCPADIAFSQDIQLLNNCREQFEQIIDDICKKHGFKHPRTRKNCARRDYLLLSKSKSDQQRQLEKQSKSSFSISEETSVLSSISL